MIIRCQYPTANINIRKTYSDLYVLTKQGPSFVGPQILHLGTKYAS